MMILKRSRIVLTYILLTISHHTYACLDHKTLLPDFVITPIANKAILNGVSIELKQISSPSCNVSCYIDQLNKQSVDASRQGTLVHIRKNSGITIEITKESNHHFEGRLICKSSVVFQPLTLPSLFYQKKYSSDFQSTDGDHVSRTILFRKISQTQLLSQLSSLKNKAREFDIQKNNAYFLLADLSELYFSYIPSLNTTDVIVIYVKSKVST